MSDDYGRAVNLLKASVRIAPLALLTQPDPRERRRGPIRARNVGDGPGLDSEHSEIAGFIRSDWRGGIKQIQDAVLRVAQFDDAGEVVEAFGAFREILVRLEAAIRRHDEERQCEAAQYPHNHPPRTGGPFQWHPDAVRKAERGWLIKSRGIDVLGATFVHFHGSPVNAIWDAWRKLIVAVEQLAATTSTPSIKDMIDRSAAEYVQKGVIALDNSGTLPPVPSTPEDKQALALYLITSKRITTLRQLAEELKHLGVKGMSKTMLHKNKVITKALEMSKQANKENIPHQSRDAKGRPIPPEFALDND